MLQVLQTLARQSLSGDLQAQAATSNATLQDRARLLQLQLQLNQIQQQQQQVLQGQKHQGGGAMPATALDALQDQVLHARDVIMQQQLQQQVDTELQAGAEDQAQRSLEALRLLKGVGGRGLSPNGRASVTSPFMAQQLVQGAGHLPLMPDMSRQLLGRERVCQAQEVRQSACLGYGTCPTCWQDFGRAVCSTQSSGWPVLGNCDWAPPSVLLPTWRRRMSSWDAQAPSFCAGLPRPRSAYGCSMCCPACVADMFSKAVHAVVMPKSSDSAPGQAACEGPTA